MKPATLKQIRQAIGGKALAPIPKPAPAVSVVCTDTRMLQPGCLFVALKGEKYDAHEFLPEAAAKGAIAAVIQDVPAQSMPNLHLIRADDTRIALGKIANLARKNMNCKVIAVAGSNGKTTTKDLINSVLTSSLRG